MSAFYAEAISEVRIISIRNYIFGSYIVLTDSRKRPEMKDKGK